MPVTSDLTEEECFLKAIADQPGDTTARLVFADWLDDRGEKPWLTEQIRKGYEFVSVERWGAVFDEYAWRGVHDRAPVPRGTGSWLDHALKAFDRKACSRCVLQFRGGFLDTVKTDVWGFFENADLFGKHPVWNIHLTDFRPRPARYDPRTSVAQQWIVYVHNISLSHARVAPSTEYTYLPPVFKHLLKGDVYESAYGDREYHTEKEARADVAQACAAYARKYFGWNKPHGV